MEIVISLLMFLGEPSVLKEHLYVQDQKMATCLKMKRIAERTERKTGQRYADVMGFIPKRIRFDLLKTTTIALRGERGRRVGQAKDIADLDLNLQRDI